MKEIRSTNDRINGKINWLNKADFKPYYNVDIETIDLDKLIDNLMFKMENEGFIFFDNEHHYIIVVNSHNKLKEVGIQFWHIK